MTTLQIALSLTVFFCVLDRLRQINWFTARPSAVALQLLQIGWALGVIYTAYVDSVAAWQVLGLVVIAAWLFFTREHWRYGVPMWVKQRPDDSAASEMERS